MQDKGKKSKKVETASVKAPELPEHIQNKDAYKKYLDIQNHPLLNAERIYNTSDPNLAIDLATVVSKIKKKIAHLPEEEQKDILAQVTAVRALLGKMSSLKQEAYGLVRGNFVDDNSFLAPRKTELIELLGRFYTVDEVHRLVNKEWGLEVSKATIQGFKIKYQDKILELQEKYKRDYSHVRLGYKRSRLDELSYLFQKRKEQFEEQPTAENHNLLLKTLEQIRKECEGDELKISFEGEININQTINLHLQNDILQKLSIKDIVLSRLCARYGVDNKLLLFRLHRSVYAKFTGTKPADQSLQEDEIIYPSQHIYDFDKIKKLNSKTQFEEAQIVEESNKEMESKKKSGMENLKQALIDKLRKKQEEVNRVSNNLENK